MGDEYSDTKAVSKCLFHYIFLLCDNELIILGDFYLLYKDIFATLAELTYPVVYCPNLVTLPNVNIRMPDPELTNSTD